MKSRNEPIGEVECPQKGCTDTAKVFRFRPRGSDGRKTVFSGKHYCECPKHGRIGADGNSTINEYILEHGTIWSPGSGTEPAPPAAGSEKNPAPARTPAPVKPPEQSRTAPAKTTPTTGPETLRAGGWRTLIDLE